MYFSMYFIYYFNIIYFVYFIYYFNISYFVYFIFYFSIICFVYFIYYYLFLFSKFHVNCVYTFYKLQVVINNILTESLHIVFWNGKSVLN